MSGVQAAVEAGIGMSILPKGAFKPGNEHVLESTQAFVDKEWEKLLKLEESTS